MDKTYTYQDIDEKMMARYVNKNKAIIFDGLSDKLFYIPRICK